MPPPPPPRMPSRPHGRPLPPLDVLFFSACFLALGWATIEVIWNLRDFWKKISLYDDVLEDETRFDRAGGSEFDEEELVEEEENIGTIGGVHSSAYGSTVFSAVPLHQQPQHTQYPHHPHYPTHIYPEDKNTSQNPLDGPQFLSASAFDDVMDTFEDEQQAIELESQIREVERKEVEAQLGVPLFQIPVVVVCIWRVDS